jgi:hypothetical protein
MLRDRVAHRLHEAVDQRGREGVPAADWMRPAGTKPFPVPAGSALPTRRAIKGLGAARLGMGHGLQFVFDLQVAAQPGCAHGTGRQAGHAGEFDHLVVA